MEVMLVRKIENGFLLTVPLGEGEEANYAYKKLDSLLAELKELFNEKPLPKLKKTVEEDEDL